MLHRPVLLEAVLDQLQIKPNAIYLDATFGRGGHSAAILKQLGSKGRLLAMDQDPEAAIFAEQHFTSDNRVLFYQGAFNHMLQWVSKLGLLGQIEGVLMDIGLSSPQLDDATRGFSFLKEGPLDMRMDPTQGQTAKQWLATASVEEMDTIFKSYGEERFSFRIAKAIANERLKAPIVNTLQLAYIVKKAHPRWPKNIHPATQVFQAIRIYINQEMTMLKQGLSQSLEVLKSGGRLAVITFHSLEAQQVKKFVRESNHETDTLDNNWIQPQQPAKIHWISKAIKASNQEIAENPRSRSAILRVIEKI